MIRNSRPDTRNEPVHHWILVQEGLRPRHARSRRKCRPPPIQLPGVRPAEYQRKEEYRRHDGNDQVLAPHVVHEPADVYIADDVHINVYKAT